MALLGVFGLFAATIALFYLVPRYVPQMAWYFLFVLYILVGFATGHSLLGVGAVLAILTTAVIRGRHPRWLGSALGGTWLLWLALVWSHSMNMQG